MKKALKKLTAIVLSLLMLCALLPGAAVASEKKVIEFWHIQNTEPFPTIIQAGVDRFMADNPDYQVNVSVMANDAFKQKISVAMSSGQMPDIFHSWSGGPMNEYVDSGNLTDLTELMNQDNYKDRFLDAAISQATYQDKIWGFPLENVAVCTIFYNKEIFEQYSLSEPTTLAELEALCDTLKENGIIPFSLANKTQWTGSMYFINFATRYGGVQPFADAISGAGSFESPAFEYAGQKLQEWVEKGYFNDGFNGLDEDSGQSRQLLYTGDAAMTMMGSWFLSTVGGENPAFLEKVGLFTFPAIEEGTGNPDTVVGTIGDNFYHIASTCEDPEGAFELLKYLSDEQSIADRVEAGRIPPLKGIEFSDPHLAQLMERVEKAPDMQLWYDQSLPPEVAEVHKVTSQELFGGNMTPQEANAQLQAAMQEYFTKKGN